MERELPVLARVTLEVSGGLAHFPGRSPQALSVLCTDARDVDQLEAFAEGARFFSRVNSDATSGPDARTYLLKIELGERSRVLIFADPVSDRELARLLRFVRALADKS